MHKPFLIAITALLTLIGIAGCAPSPMALDCNARRTIIPGTVAQ